MRTGYVRQIVAVLARLLTCLLLLTLAACGSDNENGAGEGGRVSLTAWFHTGRPEERRVMEEQVARFNREQQEVKINLVLLPEGEYNSQVQAAAAAGDLPDLLDLDGPFLANYAWQGHLQPIDSLLPERVKKGLLPSIIAQGTWRKKLYAVGVFDSGLGIYGRRSMLLKAGVRLPRGPEDAWSADEFDKVLDRLAAIDNDGRVLDLRLDYRGEWYTYAFSPLLFSAGGDLVDRHGLHTARGLLDGEAAVKAMRRVQSWFKKDLVDTNVDGNALPSGRVALSWCGHWEYPRYAAALGDDLVLLPLPDFGRGTKTGMGSWCWAVTRRCQRPDLAVRFLTFLLRTNEVLAMAGANGGVPATRDAIAASPLYGPDGPLRLFAVQLAQGYGVPRPRTPAYPVITSAFQQAFQEIRDNAPVTESLGRAAAIIDQDIADNHGYGIGQ